MDSNVSAPVVRARAVTGDAVTHYQRAGRGAPVVLITGIAALAAAVLADVPRELSLIVPDLAVDTRGFTPWLAFFLDALGLDRPVIIAVGPFVAAVQAFAAMEPDRAGRVVIIESARSSLAVAEALRSLVDFPEAEEPSDS